MRMIATVLAMLAILVVAPMVTPGPDGEPIMSPSDWIPYDLIASISGGVDRAGGLVDDLAGDMQQGANSEVGEVYRWRDANGVLHFSDAPVSGAERVALRDDALAIPAEHFVEGPLGVPVTDTTPTGKSVLLRERTGSGAASGEQPMDIRDVASELEALRRGDLSNAGEVLKNLPQLLEQAANARREVRDSQ